MAATLLALVLALPGTAVAAPGDLDTAFGGNGRVVTDFGGDDSANDVAVQPDGKIVSVGSAADSSVPESDFAVTRHNPDGTLDTGFGGDGKVTTPVNNMIADGDLQWSEAHAVALQPDGKIVVAGGSWRGYENCCWFTVVRYNADGTLDTGFGDGDGRVFTDFGTPEEAADVAVQPDGKIVAAGYVGGRAAVARYNPDGSPDTSFSGDGMVTTNPAGSTPQEGGDARALLLQPDGKIVVAGEVGTTRFDFALIRYNPDGGLDTGFGDSGIQRTDFGDYDSAEALALQPDGKIVAAGGGGGGFALARYNANGTLDPGFDGNGLVVTPGGAAQDVRLQSDGRIVVAGSGSGGFNVLRYNPDGSLDGGFGNNGRTTTSFGGSDVAHGVALQSDGRIVAVGQGGPNGDFALARYLGGGGTVPPPPPSADLSVTKAGPSSVTLGDRATYTVRVTNSATSTASATGVSLTDTLSGAGATLISATPSQGSCTTTATGATCALNTLAPGASATVTVVAEPRAAGTLRNTATAGGTPADPVTGNNTATATGTVVNSRGCTIIGTSGADRLNGTFGNDVICGLGGNDTLLGNGGTDTVYGDYGNDTIDGGAGNDTLYGGPGDDSVSGSAGNDRVVTTDGVSGNDTANGGLGTDTCTTDPGDTRISCP
ncbi:calcium-binding protein [Streptomyces arenae]|uniref:calcium-binding protein n=1 Tax=Streptomyces arenae TaxID=29301 RepID=UPI0026582DC6|nr:calcium-binding protein [Streptomyces arenae]MCG7208754.1 calcium-binding protein [Streptomyces arenae]